LPKLSAEEGGEQVEALADMFASFRVFDIDVAAARLPSTEQRSRQLANDASNLASFLAYLADEHSDQFAALQRDARAFIPGLEELQFRPIGGAGEGTVLTLVERGLPGATTLQEASYGSIRALALLALLYDPAPPRRVSPRSTRTRCGPWNGNCMARSGSASCGSPVYSG